MKVSEERLSVILSTLKLFRERRQAAEVAESGKWKTFLLFWAAGCGFAEISVLCMTYDV